LMPYIKMKMTQ